MALRFPTADINSPAAAGVNCQEKGGNEAVVGSTMSTREEVVAQMAQYADTEVISLRDLEKLFVQVATALNKAGMKELAKDAATRAFAHVGLVPSASDIAQLPANY